MIERNDWRTRRVIAACDLYCCLLPQCETLRTCHSGFPIAKLKCFHFLKIPDLGSVELTFNIPHHEEPLIREIVTKVMWEFETLTLLESIPSSHHKWVFMNPMEVSKSYISNFCSNIIFENW